MLSDSDDSYKSNSIESSTDFKESADEVEVATGQQEPYQDQDEPLVSASDSEIDGESEEGDLDGLTAIVLEARFECRVAVSKWLVTAN